MQIKFIDNLSEEKDLLVLGIEEEFNLSTLVKEIDTKLNSAVTQALNFGSFKGKKGEFISFLTPPNSEIKAILLVGLGKGENIDDNLITSIGGKIASELNRLRIAKATIAIQTSDEVKMNEANLAFGAVLKSYRFDKYRTKEKSEEKPTLRELSIFTKNKQKTEADFAELQKIADGIFLTRELVSEPPNVIYPASLAEKCKELSSLGIEVEVLGLEEMKKLGMGALLGVGQGSSKESKLVVMQWKGSINKDDQPLAFIGKGVTFDTGGISIKPSQGMEDMKYDMGGSAVVIGLMKALAGRKAKANVVGVVGLVENMPDGNAQRPSDIVKSMSGQTIEVLNTDAEGRLVLADVLWYCQDRFKPKFMIDLATLTGAITITFGSVYAGVFSNNDELTEKLIKAGQKTQEKLWRLPLHESYDKMVNSEAADIQNVSNEKGAGSITAAQFLQRFVNNIPWAHIDIAGVTWTRKDLDIIPKGATAFGVQLLNTMIKDNYEG
jgi:leucyl aminopeptidase